MFDTRRYLTNFDSTRTGNILTDVLVIGSGVAGVRAGLEAAQYGLVTLLTKKRFEDSCTHRAQGGVASALGPDDSPRSHYEDTVRVGCGLCSPDAVNLLVADGPARIGELVDWGLSPDREDGLLALTREGGHSFDRVVHAHGDQTGREIVRTLKGRVGACDNIRIFENCFVIDVITLDGVCVGVITFHKQHGHQIIWARQTILATGGCGRLWRETTNPAVATGDGLAAAFRAGVTLRDMEMMQFHPTTLYVAGAGRALISEAVRGEGGYLVDRSGNRFMQGRHPDAELAPRDIVSRTIHQHILETRSNCVYLDVRHIKGFAERFPGVARLCADFEINVKHDLIPVRPSAHYLVGGVQVDLDGSTSVQGLLCCGEVASTGVHGANRLASNSLLEGLVFGRLAGQTAGQRAQAVTSRPSVLHATNGQPPSTRTALDLPDIHNSLRSVMWRNVGIVRRGDRLCETCDILDFWAHYVLDKTFDEDTGWEVQNMLTAAKLVAMSALERRESIGTHYRSDTPNDSAPCPYHVTVTRDMNGTKTQRIEVP
ncbi:MAG: L-aspartate oxidase [Phycisphaerae bacterium]